MASRHLVITIKSVKYLKAHGVYLVVSLSGDQSDKKQRTPVHKKGSTTDPWLGHTFEFTVEEAALLDTRLEFKIEKKNTFFCFKKGSFFGRKTTYVVGEVDVSVKDLLEKGCTGVMEAKLLSCQVWTKGKTMAVLKFSYEFCEQEETVTATQAAATLSEPYVPPMRSPPVAYPQNAAPNFPAANPYRPPIPALHHQMAYVPAALLPQRPLPGWNLLGRAGIAAAVNVITDAFDNL